MKTILAITAALFTALPASSITVGQVQTFEDGTTGGWTAGIGPVQQMPAFPPANIATGGPAGVDDNFLMITATGGGGPGSRLTALNFTEWAGDFSTIDSIVMDVRNFGSTDLSLRLFFEDPIAGPPQNSAFSAQPIVLPAESAWTRISFPIHSSDLIAGDGTVENALANATVLRIFHGSSAGFPGEAVIGLLGVDNIHAAVPDAGATGALFALGSLTLAAFGRNRRLR